MKRLIVTGSRELRDYQLVESWLDIAAAFLGGVKLVTLVHGAYRGADTLARDWAIARGATPEPHPADWHLGPTAGPARNTRMVAAGGDLGVAFWTGQTGKSGTFDCLTKISRAGIPLWVVHV